MRGRQTGENGVLFGADHQRAEERRLVATKAQSLRWLEKLRESQRLTAREEKRKEEILAILRELHGISARRFDPRDFPPTRYSW
jgi:hypothetical protein